MTSVISSLSCSMLNLDWTYTLAPQCLHYLLFAEEYPTHKDTFLSASFHFKSSSLLLHFILWTFTYNASVTSWVYHNFSPYSSYDPINIGIVFSFLFEFSITNTSLFSFFSRFLHELGFLFSCLLTLTLITQNLQAPIPCNTCKWGFFKREKVFCFS